VSSRNSTLLHQEIQPRRDLWPCRRHDLRPFIATIFDLAVAVIFDPAIVMIFDPSSPQSSTLPSP
jgi:hypothetical protein